MNNPSVRSVQGHLCHDRLSIKRKSRIETRLPFKKIFEIRYIKNYRGGTWNFMTVSAISINLLLTR